MNFHKTFFLVLLVCCFFACKKDKTSEPTPDPCAGVATLVAPLQRIWSTPNQYYNAYFKPIFFGNEVIFSQLGGDYENELVGLDVKTGALGSRRVKSRRASAARPIWSFWWMFRPR